MTSTVGAMANFGLAVLALSLSHSCASPMSPGHCTDDLQRQWPADLKEEELIRTTNSYGDQPLYRLDVDGAVLAHPLPGSTHRFSLAAATPSIHRFLVSVFPEAERDEAGCGAGTLKSRTEHSEPLSYRCPNYQKEKDLRQNHSRVEFEWTAPSCGCVQIRAEVLDAVNHFVSIDDPHKALRYLSCVTKEIIDTSITDDIIDPEKVENNEDSKSAETEKWDEKEADEKEEQKKNKIIEEKIDDLETEEKEWIYDSVDVRDKELTQMDDKEKEKKEEDRVENGEGTAGEKKTGNEKGEGEEVKKGDGNVGKKKAGKEKDLNLESASGLVYTNQKRKNRRGWILRRTKRRRSMRRSGRRWCCRRGHTRRIKAASEAICQVEANHQLLDYARYEFGLSEDVCSKVYTRCCEYGTRAVQPRPMKAMRRGRGKRQRRKEEKKWENADDTSDISSVDIVSV